MSLLYSDCFYACQPAAFKRTWGAQIETETSRAMHGQEMAHSEGRRTRRHSCFKFTTNSRALIAVVPLMHMAGFGPQGASAFAPGPFAAMQGSLASIHQMGRNTQQLGALNDMRLRNVAFRNVGLRQLRRNTLQMNGGLVKAASASTAITAVPLLAWQGYQHMMGLYPLEMDAFTGVLLYILGKWTSNGITKSQSSPRVYGKWGVMGSLDGWFTHLWYVWIDVATMFLASTPALKLFTMTVVTSFVYTPMYCAMFLAVMAALDGKRGTGIWHEVKGKVGELSALTIKTWMPLNVILFGLVPATYRVLVSMLMNYVYLIGLALWESGTLGVLLGQKETPSEAGVDIEPINPSPQPALLNNENLIPSLPVDMAQPIFTFDDTATPWDQGALAPALRTDEGGVVSDTPIMHTGTVESLDHPAAHPGQPLGDTSNYL